MKPWQVDYQGPERDCTWCVSEDSRRQKQVGQENTVEVEIIEVEEVKLGLDSVIEIFHSHIYLFSYLISVTRVPDVFILDQWS